MSGLEIEKRNRNKTKYGFRTIFGLNEGRSGRRERKKLRRWEDEKVGRVQSAWGIRHRAEGRRRKAEEKEGENLRSWED